MTISLNIAFASSENIICNVNNNTIEITFNSFEEYQKFLDNPYNLIPDEADEESSKKIYKKINANLKAFCTLLKKETIYIYDLALDSDISNLPNQPLVIDLKHLNLEDEIKFLNKYSWENTTFHDAYNTLHEASKEELLDAYQELYKLAHKYKKYNLSPLETTLTIFDLVRSRFYYESQKGSALSRDLACILKNPDIVCLGYTNLFRALCEILGVETDTLLWINSVDDTKDGHASVVAYINDQKYNVKGVFAFEPTWAAIKPKNKDNYMDNYTFALQPLSLEILRKKEKNLELSSENMICIIEDNLKRTEELLSLNAPERIINKDKKMLLERINTIRDMLGKEPLEMPEDNNLELFKNFIEDFKNSTVNMVSLKKFIELIKAVRDIENEVDPETYKKDKTNIDFAIATSVSFKQYNEINNLMNAIFGKSRKRKKS